MFRMSDHQGDSAFVLSHVDVVGLIRDVSLRAFATELVAAIEATYGDRYLKPLVRTGWTRGKDTLEVMGCSSFDYTCVKVISSNPSIASPEIPAVTGTLVCTEVGADQARLVCDTSLLTPLRTAASTGVVLKRLHPHPTSVGVIGGGVEGVAHALVIALLFSDVQEILVFDEDQGRTIAAVREIEELINADAATENVRVAGCERSAIGKLFASDVIVTATYGWDPICELSLIDPETKPFIAAVGADLEGKQELDGTLYAQARFVADDVAQCLRQGELQHAAPQLGVSNDEIDRQTRHGGSLLDGRIMGVEDLLAQARTGKKRGEPITIYDSTGFSGQDLALARIMLKLCEANAVPRVPWNPPKTGYFSPLSDLAVRRSV